MTTDIEKLRHGYRCCFKKITFRRCRGFTFTELIITLVLISLFIMMAQASLVGVFRRNTFRSQAERFVSTMQMAATAASESDRKYEIIIDLTEQTYMLREITSPDIDEVLDEEIIMYEDFGENCYASYVLFDDMDYTNEGIAKFRAGRAGFQFGGKIVLLDDDDNPYTVIVNRLNGIVRLETGDVDFLFPKADYEIGF